MTEERPWGKFEVLHEDENCKVKKITVNSGQKLSLQSHEKRNETWVFVKGSGRVVLDEEFFEVEKGNAVLVPTGCKHRVINNTDSELVFVETQFGDYFGEDDIVRYQDEYGRDVVQQSLNEETTGTQTLEENTEGETQ